MGDCGIGALKDTLCEWVVEPLATRYRTLWSLPSKADELVRETKRLEDVMGDVKAKISHLLWGQSREQSNRATGWLKEVESLLGRVAEFRENFDGRRSNCNCLRCGCYNNYKLAKEADDLLERARELWTDGNNFTEDQLVIQSTEMVGVLQHLDRNCGTLLMEMRKLRSLRDVMDERVKSLVFQRQETARSREARDWFNDSESEIQSSSQVIEEYMAIGSFGCTRINSDASSSYCISDREACDSCIRGFEFGKRVIQLLTNISHLIEKGNRFSDDELVVPIVPTLLQETPIYFNVVGQEEELALALWLVSDTSGNNNMVGIWGMGGSGKTTLLKRINNHFCSMDACCFDVVLYATAGRDCSVARMQKEIAKRLGISLSERGDEEDHAKQIFLSLRSKKSCLLLLDDLWEEMDLERLGIPPLNSDLQKMVITSRFKDVCYRMNVKGNCMIQMGMLSYEESWQLFRNYVGNVDLLLDPRILPLAREVASKCGRLPLALQTVGKAMAGATGIHEWRTALSELQEPSHQIPGIIDHLLSSLILSFEKLENDAMREILFLCLAFTGNIGHLQRNSGSHGISKRSLATIIVAEGFLEEHKVPHSSSLQSAYNVALTQISKLVKSSLLMTYGSSKSKVCLHDCVIDMLLWLLRTEKCKHQQIVSWNSSLNRSSGDQLQGFFARWKDARRVSMDDSQMKEIPDDIELPICSALLSLHWHRGNMVSLPLNFFNYMPLLRYLSLSFSNIQQLPESIGCIAGLRVLLLSYTDIHSLPVGIGNLDRLIELSLAYTSMLKSIPRTCISTLRNLEKLEMQNSAFKWTWKNSGDEVSLQDLEKLREHGKLSEIHLGFVGYDSAIISGFNHSPTLINSIVSLHLDLCNDYCSANVGDQLDTISHMRKLEKLYLRGLDLSTLEQVSGGFLSIKILTIWDCLTSGSLEWITRWACELQELHLISCTSLTMILESATRNAEPFPSLRKIDLFECPKLRSISKYPLSFPALEKLAVDGCPELKNLCFDQQSAPKIRKVKGSRDWWTALQWESEDLKSKFYRIYFAPA